MIETIVVCVIVAGAVLFGIRSIYRTMTGEDGGCAGCGSGCDCAMTGGCSDTAKDTPKGKTQDAQCV